MLLWITNPNTFYRPCKAPILQQQVIICSVNSRLFLMIQPLMTKPTSLIPLPQTIVRQWCSSSSLASPVWIKKPENFLPSDQASLAQGFSYSWARCASYFGSALITSIAISMKAHSTNKKNSSARIYWTNWLWFTSNQLVRKLWKSKLKRISLGHFP